LTVKTVLKKAIGLKPWQPIETGPISRAYSFIKARRSLMQFQYPRWVIMELTTRCNSKCSYCPRPQFVKEKRLPSNRDLPFSIYIEFLEKLWKSNVDFSGQFIYGGMGEPTLYPDFEDALDFAKFQFPKSETFLMTNGITLKAMASKLIGKLDGLSVSLNTFNRETYRNFNRVDRFNQVVSNIEYFLEKKGNKKPATRIQILIMDSNRNVYQKFQKHWMPQLNSNDMLTYERFHNFVGQINVEDYSSTTPQTNLKPCLELFESLYVLSNGNLYPCCAGAVADCLLDHGGLLIGNIREDLGEVFNGVRLERLRELHKRDRQKTISACAGCDLWKGKANAFIKLGGKWR